MLNLETYVIFRATIMCYKIKHFKEMWYIYVAYACINYSDTKLLSWCLYEDSYVSTLAFNFCANFEN